MDGIFVESVEIPTASTFTQPVQVHDPIALKIESREQWLSLREGSIGGTDVPALMQGVMEASLADSKGSGDDDEEMDEEDDGENTGGSLKTSPYKTLYELWARKSGLVNSNFKGNTRVTWGNRLEDSIAQGIAEDEGWIIRKCPYYYKHPLVDRMGVSLDYEKEEEINGTPYWLPFEVKNVAWEERWKWKVEGYFAPPPHIRLQVQGQLAVTGMPAAYLGVLFGGSEPRTFRIERDDQIIEKIEQAVADFWKMVDDGTPPEPDYERDGWVIRQLNATAVPGQMTSWVENADALALIEEKQILQAEKSNYSKQANELKKQLDIVNAKLIMMIGNNEYAELGNGLIFSAVPKPATTVVQERQSRRDLRITKKKKPKNT